MARRRRGAEFGRRLALALSVLMLVRALVPAGWMPVAVAGTISLKPCPSWAAAPRSAAPVEVRTAHDGYRSAVAHAGHHPSGHDHHAVPAAAGHADHAHAAPSAAPSGPDEHSDHDSSRMDQPCAFAGLAQLGIAAAPPSLNAPLPEEAPAALATPRVSPGRGLAAPPPPATGPPRLI